MKSFKQLLHESNTTWKLDPSVKSDDFIINDDFNDIKHWQAKVFVEGSDKRGTMESVGYVMFNLTTHTFIPIAREDEHHRGYDIMSDYHKKSTSNWETTAWYPVYLNPDKYGNMRDYIYEGRERIALEVLRSLGDNGLNLRKFKVQTMGSKVMITAEQFVATGKIEHIAGQLTDEGAALIQKLQDLAAQANSIRFDPLLDKKIKGFRSKSLSMLKWFDDLYPNELLYADSFYNDVKHYIQQIRSFPDDDNLLSNIELELFGFKGFKNRIHRMLKNPKHKENTDSFFGDSDMALGIFNDM